MKIVFIGDIVARPGRTAVKDVLPKLIKEIDPDLIIANVENLAHGRGVTDTTIREMKDAGIDVFTSGDHVFWQRDSEDVIDNTPIIRPANYPKEEPGIGFRVVDLGKNGNILIINLMGRTFLNERLDDPFKKADEILAEHQGQNLSAILVDFHAEVTSEKHALAFYLDGRVDAVVGTHTHVPTCDQRVLPEGTMYVSDAGMTGNIDSVLGVKKDIIMDLYLTGRNQRFEWEDTGKRAFRSVIIDTENKEIDRYDRYL